MKLQPGITTGRGASGGGCYPDHLPVLAHVPEEAAPAAAGTIQGTILNGIVMLYLLDAVKILVYHQYMVWHSLDP